MLRNRAIHCVHPAYPFRKGLPSQSHFKVNNDNNDTKNEYGNDRMQTKTKKTRKKKKKKSDDNINAYMRVTITELSLMVTINSVDDHENNSVVFITTSIITATSSDDQDNREHYVNDTSKRADSIDNGKAMKVRKSPGNVDSHKNTQHSHNHNTLMVTAVIVLMINDAMAMHGSHNNKQSCYNRDTTPRTTAIPMMMMLIVRIWRAETVYS